MEFLVFCHEHIHGHRQRGQFGGGDGQPHAINAPQGGQEEQRGHLEQKRAQKRDECTCHAVAQCGEEGGCIDVEALDEEAQRIQPERAAGQRQQLDIVAHKDVRHMGDDDHGRRRHGHRHHGDQAQALLVEVMHLGVVARAVMEADDGRAAHGIAHEHCHEQESGIHDDAVSRHAVFPDQPQQLEVIQDIDQRHGKAGHQLRRAIDAGIPQHATIKLRSAQVQTAGVAAVDKIEHRQHAAHQLADEGGNGSALHAPVQHAHHYHVQHHIGAACTNGEPEAQMRLFGSDEKALEQILQSEARQRQHQDAPVAHGVVQQLALCAQQHGDRPQEHNAQHGQHTGRDERCPHKHGKIAVGFFLVALAQRDAYDGAAAGAQHKADSAQHLRQRHDEIDRRKGRFAHKVGNTQPVHDAIDGGEQHGADAGQHEPQQTGIVEMIGQLDGFLWHNSSFLNSAHTKRPDKNHRSGAFPLLLRHYGAHSLREARTMTSYPALQLR